MAHVWVRCGQLIPARLVHDGRTRYSSHRKYCLTCSPLDAHNTRAIPPDGTKCAKCQGPLPVGRTKFCSQRCKSRSAPYSFSRRRRNLKRKAIEYTGGKCQDCGDNRCDAAMHFHHVGGKDFEPARVIAQRSWAAAKRELDKCLLLCANCHAERHERERMVAVAQSAERHWLYCLRG
jgi:hypothetical protein